MVVRKVGKYEVGRTIGEGTFAKVKFAQNTETGESVAMKVLDRNTIIKHKMVDQIKREISIMKLVRHPYVVRLHEACYFFFPAVVLASRTKIYIILEFITGGELFDKIVRHGRLSEVESRRYFQQLIDGVDFCHSKGVFHRDLKPENLLLDSQENIKISDFGLSALPEQGVSLLRTTCGTPNYVAPEVLSHKGYDGAVADVWSCGVILYVLMAGYLPFDDLDLTTLYTIFSGKKGEDFVSGQYVSLSINFIIEKSEFSCPSWFPVGAKSLIHRILDPNPQTRINIAEIRNDEWFKKNYTPVKLLEYEEVNLDDLNAVFYDCEEQRANEQCGNVDMGPLILNAFDLIILSQGLNLASLFDRGQDCMKYQTRFVSQKPAKVVLSSMEVIAQSMGFKTHIRNFKMRVEGLSADKNSHFSVILEIFEVAPTFLMVDIQKAAGDASEYLKEVFPCSSFTRIFVAILRISSGNHPMIQANQGSTRQRVENVDSVSCNIIVCDVHSNLGLTYKDTQTYSLEEGYSLSNWNALPHSSTAPA
ncbi:CBL-interacting serine/threonine-protein kinase 8 [Morella rubra]|uniref:non-specific serine/threonine protein kinase n=1 Tax=Morella rubra TaxID=262757 RepID=A0A6A1UMM7_9ROSI|nr:CBL-interacting serine/threonine-protein kinase 8 [Morella rubra]